MIVKEGTKLCFIVRLECLDETRNDGGIKQNDSVSQAEESKCCVFISDRVPCIRPGEDGPITSIPKAMGVMGLARRTDANKDRSFDGINESCGSAASNGLKDRDVISGACPVCRSNNFPVSI